MNAHGKTLNTEARAKQREEFREKCIGLTVDVVGLCRKLHKDSSLWSISDQIIRSSGSIGANVIEGQAASSRKDFTNFMRIAYKSSQETVYWCTVLERTCREHKQTICELRDRTENIGRVLSASLKTLSVS